MNNSMHSTAKQPLGHQVPSGNQTTDLAAQNMEQLLLLKKLLGIEIEMFDRKLNRVCAEYTSLDQFLGNPETLGRLTQDLYVSDPSKTLWFELSINRGNLKSVRFVLSVLINWVNAVNKSHTNFDALIVGYSPGAGGKNAVTVVPHRDFCPERIVKHFPFLLGQNANDTKEVGKLLCYMIQHHMEMQTNQKLTYIGTIQGFSLTKAGKVQFSPPHGLHSVYIAHLPPALQSRQYPWGFGNDCEDVSVLLKPIFQKSKVLQLMLLFRITSWFQSMFSARAFPSDNIVVAKPTAQLPCDIIALLWQNTWYTSQKTVAIGPNIKPLKSELETVGDGMVVVVDPFSADQAKKAERGYALLLNDVSGASDNHSEVHHIIGMISSHADLSLPRERCCVLEPGTAFTDTTPDCLRTILRRLDHSLVTHIERGLNATDKTFMQAFNHHLENLKKALPNGLPRTKIHMFLQLVTTLRMYHELFSPLFDDDLEQYIADWLLTQEQKPQPLNDRICSEFGMLLNQKIADGEFSLILKEEVTPFDPGSKFIIVDTKKRCIYVDTDDSFAIAKNEMKTVNNTDTLTTALYDCGYLPHNSRGEKSVRIKVCASDGSRHTPYFHAISFSLISRANLQRFDLLDKQLYLFRRDEMPTEGFLPLVKTVDGRFVGKLFRYELEEQNNFFGTGRSGSGKSWALGQLMPMLRMLGCHVVIFDTSASFTEAQLRKMLPSDVVDSMFRFVHIGVEQDRVPVDLGSLSGCCSLPDRKRAVYSLLSAAVGKFDRDRVKDNQQRTALKSYLSQYLKDKRDRVDFVELTEKLRSSSLLSPRVSEVLSSVFQDIADIGCEEQGWDDLFSDDNRILVLDLGNEVGDSSHVLLDILVASLYGWQYQHNERQLAIFIDELADQNFAEQSPLNMILKQGRKQHIMLLGATQDYFSQGNSSLDVMKQATIKSYARPGKAEDRIAEKLGYANAIAAGFHQFKAGDVIVEFDALNKDSGENEPVTLRGRVIDFVETPLYERFKRDYQLTDSPSNTFEPSDLLK